MKAQKRELLGKKVKNLRSLGKVPASVYGPKRESASIVIDPAEFKKVFKDVGYSKLFELQIDDEKPQQVLVKEVQVYPLNDEVVHVSFYEVDMTHKIDAEVPVEFVGNSPAVQKSIGILIPTAHSVRVHCLPKDLPAKLVVDISGMVEVGDSIKIENIALGDGVNLAPGVVGHNAIAYIAAPQKLVEVETAPAEGEKTEEVNAEEPAKE